MRDTSVIDLYERACSWGYLPGCTQVARIYEGGILVARDENRARELYRSSCLARQLGRLETSQVRYERGCNLGDGSACRWRHVPR